GAGNRERRIARAEDELGRVDERVAAALHRSRPGVPGGALDHDLAAREANDRGDDAERLLAAQQHRPLLDVHLDVDIGPVRGAQAPAEAALFVTERNDAD